MNEGGASGAGPGVARGPAGSRTALFLIALTLVAAVLRLWSLGEIPPGLHGDEAWTGIDAHRVQEEGWIGPYVSSGLGQASGPLYWAALVLGIIGDGVVRLRVTMALLGIATIPVLYLAVRQMFDKRVALISSVLLSTMMWHLFYSRIAFMVISWPLMQMATLGFFFAARRTGSIRHFVVAGLFLGAGMYTYNVYPLFVLALGLVSLLCIFASKAPRKPLIVGIAAMFGVSAVAAAPMLIFAMTPSNHFFNHHSQFSYFNTQEYQDEDLPGRVSLLTGKAHDWIAAMVWRASPDGGDGAGSRPMLDPLTVTLALTGVAFCLWHLRGPPYQALLVLFVLLPIGSFVSVDGQFRRALGLAPILSVLAALPLAALWGSAQRSFRRTRALLVVSILALVSMVNVRGYFGTLGVSQLAHWVFAEEIAAASEFLAARPSQPYTYFMSSRWGFDYETRRYIAPDFPGEDLPANPETLPGWLDRSRDNLFLLLPPFLPFLDPIRSLHPDGQVFEDSSASPPMFVAYHVPRLDSVPRIQLSSRQSWQLGQRSVARKPDSEWGFARGLAPCRSCGKAGCGDALD